MDMSNEGEMNKLCENEPELGICMYLQLDDIRMSHAGITRLTRYRFPSFNLIPYVLFLNHIHRSSF